MRRCCRPTPTRLSGQADHAARPLRPRTQVAFNIGGHVGEPKPLVLPSGVSTDKLSEGGETDLSRWFLLGALLLLLADLFISLWLRGLLGRAVRFGRRTGGPATAALLLVAGAAVLFAAPPDAEAQVAIASKLSPLRPTATSPLRGEER